MAKAEAVFGKPEEWRTFIIRHPSWQEALSRLMPALERVFVRDVPVDENRVNVIFGLGRVAVEDFAEILLLAGNGYGIAGLKILRGMYERVVTALYLSLHSEEVEDFLSYHYVHQRKLVNHAKSGVDLTPLATRIAEIEAEYQRVKSRYEEVVCRACGTTKPQPSWTKRDLKTMADEVGLGTAYAAMYFWPTLMHHTTLAGLNARYEPSGDDLVIFQHEAQHEEADDALGHAHMLLLVLLQRFNELINAGLTNIDGLIADFTRCWNRPVGKVDSRSTTFDD